MQFFSKKKEVRLINFCSDYYEKNFLEPVIENLDMSNAYEKLMMQKINEVDKSFTNITLTDFVLEMLNIKFETFAVAWLHQFGNDLAIENSVFTLKYLDEKGHHDILKNIEPYNQAVARSANFGGDPNTNSGKSKIMALNKTKVALFNKYIDKGYEGECVAKVLNRLGTEDTWRKSITPNFLRIQLTERLGCELNEEANFRLTSFIFGFYKGAQQAWEKIKIIN